MKNLFTTATFWNAVFTAAIGIGAAVTAPNVDNTTKALQVGGIVLGAIGVATGRVNATGPAYTPSFLPGPNKDD